MATEAVTAFETETAKALAERAGDSGWLAERRLEALKRFEALDWPSPTLEEWRYTDLRDFDLDAYDPLPPAWPAVSGREELPDGALEGAGAVGDRAGLAVQVDTDVVHRRVAPEIERAGVIFSTVSAAAREHPELVRDVLGSAGVSPTDEKLTTLAGAFASGGTFVYVPRGVEIDHPLQTVRWLASPGAAVFPRTVVVADEGAAVTVIDLHRSAPDLAGGLSVGTVEIYAHPAANVSYLAVQDWSHEVWHFNVQRAVVRKDATVRMLGGTLGGRLSRSVVQSVLAEPGAESEMLGVYFGDGHQHFDHRSLQDHIAPNTRSELYYKGALKGRARAVYSGMVHIGKEAQKTDAWQGNRNLLLSDEAKADSIPYLEIEANDVRCGHGASVGPPDRDALFYLQSRGLDAPEAERLMVKGFFQEVLDRVRVPWVRESLEEAVEAELDVE